MTNKRADESSKETAIEMWNSGSSSGDIAHKLDFTRSQVMGIIHRAKKAGKAISKGPPRPDHRKPVYRKKVALNIVVPKEDLPKIAPSKPIPPFVFGRMVSGAKMDPTPMKPEPKLKVDKTYRGPKNILNVGEGDCRWVVSPGMFCSRPVKAVGKSWCEEHHKIVFVPSHHRDKKSNAEALMQKLRFNF